MGIAAAGNSGTVITNLIAPRLGGRRLLTVALAGLSVSYALVATGPSLQPLTALLVLAMACCGLGNGAVFQLVPLRFRDELGLVTGSTAAASAPALSCSRSPRCWWPACSRD
jgi:NNP family nitrate/nitrite transporter-like MFS transporter